MANERRHTREGDEHKAGYADLLTEKDLCVSAAVQGRDDFMTLIVQHQALLSLVREISHYRLKREGEWITRASPQNFRTETNSYVRHSRRSSLASKNKNMTIGQTRHPL